VLDGTMPASGRSTATLVLTRGRRIKLPQRCRLADSFVDTEPSGAFHERLERDVSPCSSRVSSFRSGHVDAADFPELEAPSTVGDPARTLFREPMWSAARRWPAGAVAARVHRC